MKMGRCKDCKKYLKGRDRNIYGRCRCAVLKEEIGQEKDCPFWTDDPLWLEKAIADIAAYRARMDGQIVQKNITTNSRKRKKACNR